MVSAVSQTASATLRGNAHGSARGEDDAATAVWLSALPCAAVVALAALLPGAAGGNKARSRCRHMHVRALR